MLFFYIGFILFTGVFNLPGLPTSILFSITPGAKKRRLNGHTFSYGKTPRLDFFIFTFWGCVVYYFVDLLWLYVMFYHIPLLVWVLVPLTIKIHMEMERENLTYSIDSMTAQIISIVLTGIFVLTFVEFNLY